MSKARLTTAHFLIGLGEYIRDVGRFIEGKPPPLHPMYKSNAELSGTAGGKVYMDRQPDRWGDK